MTPQVAPAGPSSPGRFVDRLPAWADATGIHYGDKTLRTTGPAPLTLAQTDHGFVSTDRDGNVYFTDGDKARQIGDGDASQRLTVDDSGSFVGWVDNGSSTPSKNAEAAPPQFVVYDTSTQREILRLDNSGQATRPPGKASGTDVPRVIAIDGNDAYLRSGGITNRVNLQTGDQQTIIQSDAGFVLQDAAGGTYSVSRDKPTPDARIGVSTNLDHVTTWLDGSETNLSPTGRYLYLDWADRPAHSGPAGLINIVDTRTGQRVNIAHTHLHLSLVQWLDDDRFTAVGTDWDTISADDPGPKPVDLLTCKISTGGCEVVKKAVTTSNFDQTLDPGFAVPDGRQLTDNDF